MTRDIGPEVLKKFKGLLRLYVGSNFDHISLLNKGGITHFNKLLVIKLMQRRVSGTN